MRKSFVNALMQLCPKHEGLMLLTADLGFNLFEPLMKAHPRQFLNCGIAEANMVGVAAGLAMSGRTPFVYSIAPFITLRAFEQIKLDICLHKLNVKLVGVGAGVDYSQLGISHYSLEDITFMSTLPGMRIYNPGDQKEVHECVDELMHYQGPCYLRLGTVAVPEHLPHQRMVNKGYVLLVEGGSAVVFVTGSRLPFYWEKREWLKSKGIALVHVPRLQPLAREGLQNILKTKKWALTVEDQYAGFGLSHSIADIIAHDGMGVKHRSFGFEQKIVDRFGNNTFVRDYCKSSDNAVIEFLSQLADHG